MSVCPAKATQSVRGAESRGADSPAHGFVMRASMDAGTGAVAAQMGAGCLTLTTSHGDQWYA